MRKKIIPLFLLVVLLTGLMTFGCSPNEGEDNSEGNGIEGDASLTLEEVTIMASPVGGVWYPLAVGLGELLTREHGTKITIGPGGGVSNIIACHTGEAEFGITTSNTLFDALNQDPPFDEEKELFDGFRYVASLYPNVAHFIVLKDSDIYSFKDLKGKRVCVTPRGFSSEAANVQILEAFDMSYDDFKATEFLGYTEANELMADGRLDAILNPVAPAPHASYIDLATRRDIRFLELGDDEVKRISERQPAFTSGGIIPAGTYKGVEEDVEALQVPLVLIASVNTPDDIAYEMAKLITENIEKLGDTNVAMKGREPSYIAADIGIETHPGALKYYEEQGLR